jgi:hypothetical protein
MIVFLFDIDLLYSPGVVKENVFGKLLFCFTVFIIDQRIISSGLKAVSFNEIRFCFFKQLALILFNYVWIMETRF